MFRCVSALACLVAVADLNMADDAAAHSTIARGMRVPANTGFAWTVSPDGQAGTLLLDDMVVSTSPTTSGIAGNFNQTSIQTKVVSFEMPYSTDQKAVSVTMDIRGFASTENSLTRLVVCCGDATKPIDTKPDRQGNVKLKGKAKQVISRMNPKLTLGDFHSRIDLTLQPAAAKPIAQITLFLVAEHDADKGGGALLAVDSLDLSIKSDSKGSLKP